MLVTLRNCWNGITRAIRELGKNDCSESFFVSINFMSAGMMPNFERGQGLISRQMRMLILEVILGCPNFLAPAILGAIPSKNSKEPSAQEKTSPEMNVVGRCCRGALRETGSQDPVAARVPI